MMIATQYSVKTMKINPDQASEWLGGNVRNRPISQKVVDKYAADMAAGLWRDNSTAIAVVVGVDEPAGDAFGTVGANLAGIGVKDVHAIDLDLNLFGLGIKDFDVGLTEDYKQVGETHSIQTHVVHQYDYPDLPLLDSLVFPSQARETTALLHPKIGCVRFTEMMPPGRHVDSENIAQFGSVRGFAYPRRDERSPNAIPT